jgi:hypothetical protein
VDASSTLLRCVRRFTSSHEPRCQQVRVPGCRRAPGSCICQINLNSSIVEVL